jgi:hypothetical protein
MQLLRLKMLELRQVVPVLIQHLVGHLFDLGKGEHGGAERVVGDGLEDQARVAGQRGLDGNTLSSKLTLT